MFDLVIVGGGSAGCVLANRLSADPKVKVALLEAGPAHHRSFKVRAPGLYQTLWRTPLDWGFSTEPQQHVDGRRMFWPRGKVLGGTSSLNAMVYIRGHHHNYDEWRALGNPGWGWSDVLPYFLRSEDNVRGASALHGAGGPLHVSDCPTPSRAAQAFIDAAAARCKVRITKDFNGEDQEGAGQFQHTLRDGVRADTASAFLDPIRARPNLTIITEALATKLVVDGDRVRGVRIRVRNSEQTIEANEVLLCGGAIGSPHLLMLSGIGAGDELRGAGVVPVHELPGVGKHLQDHDRREGRGSDRARAVVWRREDGRTSGFVEAERTGGSLGLGACTAFVDCPTPRCSTPTRAQEGLPADPKLLRTIEQAAERCLGTWCSRAHARLPPSCERTRDARGRSRDRTSSLTLKARISTTRAISRNQLPSSNETRRRGADCEHRARQRGARDAGRLPGHRGRSSSPPGSSRRSSSIRPAEAVAQAAEGVEGPLDKLEALVAGLGSANSAKPRPKQKAVRAFDRSGVARRRSRPSRRQR